MSDRYNVGGMFRVDTSQVLAMSYNFANGPKIVQREMTKGMRLATSDTRSNIRKLTPHGTSGKLAANLETKVIVTNSLRTDENAINAGPGVSGMVLIRAAKVHYAWWVNYGRGAIRPRFKKWLRFRAKDGNIVFTKFVKPEPGKFFMERGLANSRSDINRAMDSAADRIARFLTGTGR